MSTNQSCVCCRCCLLRSPMFLHVSSELSGFRHDPQVVKDVPWFTERIIHDITLGSLILVMLYRVAQYNLTSLQVRVFVVMSSFACPCTVDRWFGLVGWVQDAYMHTTTFAALANMSPHCQNIHQYAAQRMVQVLHLLTKKYERLNQRLQALRAANAGVPASGDTHVSMHSSAAGAIDDEEAVGAGCCSRSWACPYPCGCSFFRS
jgi:hypothetical protein